MGGRLEELTGPAGAIEQHGPHLPLSVDWIIADDVAKAVVDQIGDELPVRR